jgi:hypothetical protein
MFPSRFHNGCTAQQDRASPWNKRCACLVYTAEYLIAVYWGEKHLVDYRVPIATSRASSLHVAKTMHAACSIACRDFRGGEIYWWWQM